MTLYEKLYKRINDIQDIAHFDHLSIGSSNASIEVTKLCNDLKKLLKMNLKINHGYLIKR